MSPRLRVPACDPMPPAHHLPTDLGRTRPIKAAIWRGLRKLCPACGGARVIEGYLGIVAACPHCGERLGHIRADDGPAYFTVLISGHLVVPLALVVEQAWHPPLELEMVGGLSVMGLLIWRLLPRIKGAVLGLMWAHGLRGDEVQGEEGHHE